MAEGNLGTLYEFNKQILANMPPQDPDVLSAVYVTIGDWFSLPHKPSYYMVMCKEKSDFTLIHITGHNYSGALQELKEILQERGEIIAIQYVHGEDAYECWVKDKSGEVFLYMLFEASWMVVDV